MSNNKSANPISVNPAARPPAQTLANAACTRRGAGSLFLLLAALCGPANAVASHAEAESVVKNQPCTGGETVDQFLDHKLKPSHRDLGWRVFAREGGFDVERAFLASKSMELRYRWRVSTNGAAQPASGRAESLCS